MKNTFYPVVGMLAPGILALPLTAPGLIVNFSSMDRFGGSPVG